MLQNLNMHIYGQKDRDRENVHLMRFIIKQHTTFAFIYSSIYACCYIIFNVYNTCFVAYVFFTLSIEDWLCGFLFALVFCTEYELYFSCQAKTMCSANLLFPFLLVLLLLMLLLFPQLSSSSSNSNIFLSFYSVKTSSHTAYNYYE